MKLFDVMTRTQTLSFSHEVRETSQAVILKPLGLGIQPIKTNSEIFSISWISDLFSTSGQAGRCHQPPLTFTPEDDSKTVGNTDQPKYLYPFTPEDDSKPVGATNHPLHLPPPEDDDKLVGVTLKHVLI